MDIDPNLGEDGLVEESAFGVEHGTVEITSLPHQVEQKIDMFAYSLHVSAGGTDESLGIGNLGSNAFLPRLYIFGRNNTVEISVDQALLLELQSLQTPALGAGQFGRFGAVSIKNGVGLGTCHSYLVGGELDSGVPFVLDSLLKLFDRHIGQVAVGAAGVAAETEEVAVGTTQLSLGVVIAHASTAAGTDKAALERMVMLPRPVSGNTSTTEDRLYLVPGVVVDERFMSAVVDHTTMHDLADVVRVTE